MGTEKDVKLPVRSPNIYDKKPLARYLGHSYMEMQYDSAAMGLFYRYYLSDKTDYYPQLEAAFFTLAFLAAFGRPKEEEDKPLKSFATVVADLIVCPSVKQSVKKKLRAIISTNEIIAPYQVASIVGKAIAMCGYRPRLDLANAVQVIRNYELINSRRDFGVAVAKQVNNLTEEYEENE